MRLDIARGEAEVFRAVADARRDEILAGAEKGSQVCSRPKNMKSTLSALFDPFDLLESEPSFFSLISRLMKK